MCTFNSVRRHSWLLGPWTWSGLYSITTLKPPVYVKRWESECVNNNAIVTDTKEKVDNETSTTAALFIKRLSNNCRDFHRTVIGSHCINSSIMSVRYWTEGCFTWKVRFCFNITPVLVYNDNLHGFSFTTKLES
jgi:hypothetical protein